jgi:hypothetical protein
VPLHETNDPDLDIAHPLPGGGSVSARELLAICSEIGCTKDEFMGAGMAWYGMCCAAAVLPDFTAPTFADVLRKTIEISKRRIQ